MPGLFDRFSRSLLRSPTFQLGAGILGAPRDATFGQGLLSGTLTAFELQRRLDEQERLRDRVRLEEERNKIAQQRLEEIDRPAGQRAQARANREQELFNRGVAEQAQRDAQRQVAREVFSDRRLTPQQQVSEFIARTGDISQSFLLPQFGGRGGGQGPRRITTGSNPVNDRIFGEEAASAIDQIAEELGLPVQFVAIEYANFARGAVDRFAGQRTTSSFIVEFRNRLIQKIQAEQEAARTGQQGAGSTVTPPPATQGGLLQQGGGNVGVLGSTQPAVPITTPPAATQPVPIGRGPNIPPLTIPITQRPEPTTAVTPTPSQQRPQLTQAIVDGFRATIQRFGILSPEVKAEHDRIAQSHGAEAAEEMFNRARRGL